MPELSEDKYVAFVSGLGVGDEKGDPLRLALIVDYLTAQLGSEAEQSGIASKVPEPATSSHPHRIRGGNLAHACGFPLPV